MVHYGAWWLELIPGWGTDSISSMWEPKLRALDSCCTLCTVRSVHCDQQCWNCLGVHIFKTNLETHIIRISKNQNDSRTTMLSGLWHCCSNSKRIPAGEARVKRKETSLCFCVGSCLWVLLGIASQSQHLPILLVIIMHFTMRQWEPRKTFLGKLRGRLCQTKYKCLGLSCYVFYKRSFVAPACGWSMAILGSLVAWRIMNRRDEGENWGLPMIIAKENTVKLRKIIF